MCKRTILLSACGLLACGLLLVVRAVVADPTDPAPSIFAPRAETPPVAKPADAATTPAPRRSAADHSSAKSEPGNFIRRLDVKVTPGGNLEDAYDDYFRKNVVLPKVVRARVRRLMAAAKESKRPAEIVALHSEIIALIDAAIRNGQSQPWMYEALALSMEIVKRPVQDIERALMSAADFTTNPIEIMYLAKYMARLGHEARALQLYRQASALAPSRTEPFELGLPLAQRLKDLDAIQWASLGILRQAWPQEKASLQQSARYSAEAAIDTLRKDGRVKEADAFAAAVAEASLRDVKVRAYWEGEAEVDVMVEEPGGTICSLRNQRTTSGGTLVDDSNNELDPSATHGSSETYTCPEGFSGTYRVLLRLVFGKIPAGKVTVETTTRDSAGKPKTTLQQIPVSSDRDAMVVFDLPAGRRHESLQLQQIATDVEQQLDVNRAVALKLNALSSQDAIERQQLAAQAQTPFVSSVTPVVGPNGVAGFQPQLTLLPTGATLTATAVISADRRYVRITAVPLFSNISSVSTFSIAQGTTTTTTAAMAAAAGAAAAAAGGAAAGAAAAGAAAAGAAAAGAAAAGAAAAGAAAAVVH